MSQFPNARPKPSGMFGNIGAVKARMDANYVRPGNYLMLINRVKADTSRANGDFIAFEMTVLHVIDPREFDQIKGQRPHRPGESVSLLEFKKRDMFLPNMKSHIGGITGTDPNEVSQEIAEYAIGDDQPFAGFVVEVMARQITTKKNEPFTQVTFRRQVPASETLRTVAADVRKANFKDGYLETMAANEPKTAPAVTEVKVG